MRLAPVLLLALTLVPSAATAQVELVPQTGPTLESFVPSGYTLISHASGHLNGDEESDAVLVIADRREKTEPKGDGLAPRLLIVLHGTGSGYRLGLATATAVLAAREGGAFGDPLEAISLDRNVIVLRHYGGSAWRWRFTHRFRFQQGEYRLIGRTEVSFFNGRRCDKLGEFQPTTFKDDNYLTRHRYRYEVPEGRCARLEKRSRLEARPLRLLRDFDLLADIGR